MTLDQARQIYDALIAQQIADPMGSIQSVQIGGRMVTYRSADDLMKLISYWGRIVATLSRGSRLSFMTPNFRDPCR